MEIRTTVFTSASGDPLNSQLVVTRISSKSCVVDIETEYRSGLISKPSDIRTVKFEGVHWPSDLREGQVIGYRDHYTGTTHLRDPMKMASSASITTAYEAKVPNKPMRSKAAYQDNRPYLRKKKGR